MWRNNNNCVMIFAFMLKRSRHLSVATLFELHFYSINKGENTSLSRISSSIFCQSWAHTRPEMPGPTYNSVQANHIRCRALLLERSRSSLSLRLAASIWSSWTWVRLLNWCNIFFTIRFSEHRNCNYCFCSSWKPNQKLRVKSRTW